ncbi:MAG TPA: VWA domain-containing protein [Verrucomicrobiales bacterium]|jgi:Ca-activated chloride channel family protein|nr:VWA domain-containing protein [Verrucomicrobiales bacterium]
MIEGLEFVHPQLLWLLLALPVLLIWKGLRGRPVAVRLPSTLDAAESGFQPRSLIGGFRMLPVIAALACLIVALARPRLGRGTTDIESSGIDILLTIDVSGSMEAMDFKLQGQPANRIDVVKDVVARFIKDRPNDQMGVVAFAGRPYLVAPLTMDQKFLASRVGDLRIGLVEDGTAIGSAIASAVDHLRQSKAKSRIVILLTDGVNNAGAANPVTSAEAAKALGIKIYTIGAGTRGEAPMPAGRDIFGRVQMANMKVDIDEEMLQKVADITGGRMFRATDTDSLEKIYESINQLETTTRKIKKYKDYEELYLWALLPGLGILVTGWVLGQTIWRRLP